MRTTLLLALLLLIPTSSQADVRGIAFGIATARVLNYDGLGGCRLLVVEDRLSVVDFVVGDLANSCAAVTLGTRIEVPVEDALPIPCVPENCPKVSEGGHFTGLSLIQPD